MNHSADLQSPDVPGGQKYLFSVGVVLPNSNIRQPVLLSLLVGIIICLSLFSASPVFAKSSIAVLYPDVPAPYSSIFEKILSGISSNSLFTYHYYPLNKKTDIKQLSSQLKSEQIDGVIALGRSGYFATKKIKTDRPIIVGALQLIPNGVSGISLAVDPEMLFRQLRTLVPKVERVSVVYTPKTNGWLIPLAKKAAKRNGVQLNSFPAGSLREAMHHYRDLLKDVNRQTDAIWLPLDRVTANDDVVLPMLLQLAWEKDLVLCSSKPLHVQQGALFSMYPDNQALGKRLIEMLTKRLEAPHTPEVVPLVDLSLAVNLRTASHLGLQFTSDLQEEFTLTFPSR